MSCVFIPLRFSPPSCKLLMASAHAAPHPIADNMYVNVCLQREFLMGVVVRNTHHLCSSSAPTSIILTVFPRSQRRMFHGDVSTRPLFNCVLQYFVTIYFLCFIALQSPKLLTSRGQTWNNNIPCVLGQRHPNPHFLQGSTVIVGKAQETPRSSIHHPASPYEERAQCLTVPMSHPVCGRRASPAGHRISMSLQFI